VDIAIIETGLGGRLDSTNIISPILSIITNIGLDHCDLLGDTLGEIAFEKAGIIKEKTPVIIGENHPETDPIFERKTLYSNLSQADFFSDRTRAMSLLTFAEKTYPQLWDDHKEIMSEMDLQGEYQKKNLRTSLVAIEKLQEIGVLNTNTEQIKDAIIHTAARMDFHGRWEKLLQDPYTICDIGHNEHGLKYNFAQLSKMLDKGEVSSLTIIYGSVADKDINSVLDLMPKNAFYVFTQANSRRALSAKTIQEKFLNHHSDFPENQTKAFEDVESAVRFAIEKAKEDKQRPMIYIGGSTYIVSEASEYILNTK
jgi:dihydrofolate synthase/folylpolyglutamate synthase